MANKNRCLTPTTDDECKRARLYLQDTLDVVGGKWKLVLISILRGGKLKFRELTREAGISARILSKELKEMELNGLITRTVVKTSPIMVEYELTPYSNTLSEVITAMHEWGKNHRQKIIGQQSTEPNSL
ncbi:winged helix-turn-helix transcriptional regulator [Chitinophaga tropicalis]|uniref:Transcriptional regulator n=1 Tax=Chitinophaga tropicalis TaxID=2683588 RepID=A0A7K1U523_9BACT|nr:helix-turn-helix domain-containing protein [Chitinophaga tropicalis]MVT09440.1 transcriptional regulator [Chitinophaga tropicalis]